MRTTIKIAAPVYTALRVTIPCQEALMRAGNQVVQVQAAGRWQLYDVTLYGTVPVGIVECLIGPGDTQHRGLRMRIEPAYPSEWPAQAVAWWERGQWVPCPVRSCRVCTQGHHSQLSRDGRRAARR